jgi:predicted RND superfamily exporter protein
MQAVTFGAGDRLLALSRFAIARPRRALAASLLVSFALGAGLFRLEIRTDGAAIHPRGDPVMLRADEDRRTFGHPYRDPRELVVLLTRSTAASPALDSAAGLRAIERIRDSLASLEGLHPVGVLSLGTIPDGMPAALSLPFPTFLDSIPEDPDSLEARRERIHRDPLAHGLFLSRDAEAAAFYVNFADTVEARRAIRSVRSWIASAPDPRYDVELLGPLVVETTLGEKVAADLARLVPIMVLVVAVLLAFFLRSPAGVIVPLGSASIVLLSVLGAMGWLGAPVTLLTTILPVLLLTMGITDEIHLMERIEARLRSGERDVAAAALLALREVLHPIVTTSVTTSVAFLSFASTSIGPLRDFGVFASLGILYAMLLTFTVVPALLALLPPAWLRPHRPAARRELPARETPAARARRVPRRVAALVLLAAGLPGVLRLFVEDSWVSNFDPHSALARADRRFNESFWGTYRFDVVFEAEDWFFYTPGGAALMERFGELAARGPHVGGVFHYLVPLEQVADEFRLALPVSALSEREIRRLGDGAEIAVGRPLMSLLVTWNGSAARARVFLRDANQRRGAAFEEYLERELPALLAGGGITAHASGDLPEAMAVVRAVVGNQLRSIAWTAAGVALLVALALRSVAGGLLLMTPVLAAAWALFAGIGYAGLPLGIATSMFASLTIGVGVDYALHLAHGFRRYRDAGEEQSAALAAALATSGRAIRWNAFTLGIGFLVLSFSGLPPNRALGALLAAAMFASYATTLFFLPGLLPRLERDRSARTR